MLSSRSVDALVNDCVWRQGQLLPYIHPTAPVAMRRY